MRFDDTDKEEEELMGFKILWVITGCFAFLSIVISVQLIRAHLAHFSHPVLQVFQRIYPKVSSPLYKPWPVSLIE